MTTANAARDSGSDWFWCIIANAQGDRERLRTQLLRLEQQELRDFHSEFIDLASELPCPPFDAFVEVSEDGLNDVAEWVISQGKELYQSVLTNPASIPHSVEGKGRQILSGVAPLVYEERFGEPLDVC